MSQPYRHATSMRVANTPAELMWKHGGWCLLRPVRADQSEQTRRVHAHSFIKKKTWLPILHMFAWKFAALLLYVLFIFSSFWLNGCAYLRLRSQSPVRPDWSAPTDLSRHQPPCFHISSVKCFCNLGHAGGVAVWLRHRQILEDWLVVQTQWRCCSNRRCDKIMCHVNIFQ